MTIATNEVTLAGTNTFTGTDITIEPDVTWTVPDNATLNLFGDDPDPTNVYIDDFMVVDGTIHCAEDTELFGKDHLTINGNDVNMDCPDACIMADGGTVTFSSGVTQSFSNGAFYLSRNGGTTVLEDNAQLILGSTAKAGITLVEKNSTFLLGDGAEIELNNDYTFEATTLGPVVFDALTPGANGSLRVTAGNELTLLDGGSPDPAPAPFVLGSGIEWIIENGASLVLERCPLRGETRLVFSLARAGEVRLSVFDMLGRRVAVVVEGVYPAGRHEAVWQAAGLPAGLYVGRLAVPGTPLRVRQMVLAK